MLPLISNIHFDWSISGILKSTLFCLLLMQMGLTVCPTVWEQADGDVLELMAGDAWESDADPDTDERDEVDESCNSLSHVNLLDAQSGDQTPQRFNHLNQNRSDAPREILTPPPESLA
ncbi:MAG: hypothetical protein R2792_04530 [Saprospiraceae bacterium]